MGKAIFYMRDVGGAVPYKENAIRVGADIIRPHITKSSSSVGADIIRPQKRSLAFARLLFLLFFDIRNNILNGAIQGSAELI